jgi:cbb3-type cytochrome oxidase cytochrome c subunit
MEKNVGFYSLLVSLATSVLVELLFYALAMQKVRENMMYTTVDVYGGMVFVFLLSMIVAASIWPGVIEKRMTKR